MPSKQSAERLRQQYGDRYIPDSYPTTELSETESESDLEPKSPSLKSVVESSMIEEHEVRSLTVVWVPCPLMLQLQIEVSAQPLRLDTSAQPDSDYTRQDSQSSIPDAIQRFRVMFDDPHSFNMSLINGESSQMPTAVVENCATCQGHWVGVSETELQSQRTDKVRYSSTSDLSDPGSLTCFLCQANSESLSSFSLTTTCACIISQNPIASKQAPSKRPPRNITPRRARKLAARLSKELHLLESLQMRTRHLYHKMLVLSRGENNSSYIEE